MIKIVGDVFHTIVITVITIAKGVYT